MVNPDDLLPSSNRETLKKFQEGSLKQEAKEGAVKHRLFRKNVVERKIEDVYLPILIIPGVASSGLVVKESSLNKNYEGQRLWMNAGFLAKSRLQNKVFNEDEINDDTKNDEESSIDTFAKAEDDLAIKNAWIHHIGLDSNMIDDKPGIKVRAYEGVSTSKSLLNTL